MEYRALATVQGILGTFCGLTYADLRGWLERTVRGLLCGVHQGTLGLMFNALDAFRHQVEQCVDVIQNGQTLWPTQKTDIVNEINTIGLGIVRGMAMIEEVGRSYVEGSLGYRWLRGELLYQRG
jgi:hypothetical protein